ncbi:hypothetical protein E4P39_11880 [Blastococcus sp. CT_GayMR19]|nr:hypothetical protein E4P39_11880 [Blastococcus sp. CT_GayMR19]
MRARRRRTGRRRRRRRCRSRARRSRGRSARSAWRGWSSALWSRFLRPSDRELRSRRRGLVDRPGGETARSRIHPCRWRRFTRQRYWPPLRASG